MSDSWDGSGWTPEPEYASDSGDLLNDFYLPALRGAVSYDRITGFFASSALALYWEALPDFIDRGGRLRILCSPRVTGRDAQGIERGYEARSDKALAAELREEFEILLGDPVLRRPALALAALISVGAVDVRLARVAAATLDDRRMFHDKVGLFADAAGRRLGFRGSLNETASGIASDGNVESFDAWASWVGSNDQKRVERATERFERLWLGQSPGVEVLALPAPFRGWLELQARDFDWREFAKEMDNSSTSVSPINDAPDGRPLRVQQIRGLEAWESNGRRGILAHATGSGKTVTGLTAICRHRGAALVIAPSSLVARQWVDQIESTGRRVQLCGDGETAWRTRLRTWLASPASERVIVALGPTASQPEFANQASRAVDLLLVGDEVHRLGAPSMRSILQIPAAARLGLSATPERAGDSDGTQAVFDYFGGVVDTYTLQDALADGALAPYRYYPQLVRLTAAEEEEWDALSKRIGKSIARARTGRDDDRLPESTKILLMQRARIAKGAAAKTPLALDLVARHFRQGQRWLIYCDDQHQMVGVSSGLRAAGVDAYVYHSKMPGDKASTIRHFEENGGVVVAIKCLDEGVDVPNATHALILASSRNPREFIQRRGRVLRKSSGKQFATIYDAIIEPPTLENSSTSSLLSGELARAGNFASSALNTDAREPLEQLVMNLGGDLRRLYQHLGGSGEEDDDAH